jgi:hypothetical protein
MKTHRRGIEPLTTWFEARYSIQLSYRCIEEKIYIPGHLGYNEFKIIPQNQSFLERVMLHQLLILRAEHKNNGRFRLNCFSENLGRFWCSATARKSCPFSSPSLIEAFVELMPNCGYLIKEADIIDTYAHIREDKERLQSLLLMTSLIETNIPNEAPSSQTYHLIYTLFQDLHRFVDWKTPPFILALSLFEHHGIDLSSLQDNPRLSIDSKAILSRFMHEQLQDPYQLFITEELLKAACESL